MAVKLILALAIGLASCKGQEIDYEDLFGPSVEYLNGNYWGQYFFDAKLGYKIPHGRGRDY